MLEVFRAREQTFFLAWVKMGDRSTEPCHWMCAKPNWKGPAMSGGGNTRKDQKAEAKDRQGQNDQEDGGACGGTGGTGTPAGVSELLERHEVASRMTGAQVGCHSRTLYHVPCTLYPVPCILYPVLTLCTPCAQLAAHKFKLQTLKDIWDATRDEADKKAWLDAARGEMPSYEQSFNRLGGNSRSQGGA